MNGREKASIVIVAFEAAPFIGRALVSVSQQTEKRWELIVVEDGSHDGTSRIVSEFASKHLSNRVVYSNLGSNHGVSSARNRGLDLAHGKFVAFLDADDEWMANHLATTLETCEAGAALAVSMVQMWDDEQNKRIGTIAPSKRQLVNPAKELFRDSFVQTSSSVCLRKITLSKVGKFDETLRIGEDRDMWFRVAQSGGRLMCSGIASCRYRKHNRSSMSKTMMVAEQNVRFYEKHHSASGVGPMVRRIKLTNALRTLARLTQRAHPRKALRMFIRAWKTWPLGFDLPIRALYAFAIPK